MEQFSQSSFQQAFSTIDQACSKLTPEDQALIIIGDPGVGKSTVASILAGHHLVTHQINDKTALETLNPNTSFKINHRKVTQPQDFSKTTNGNLDIIDCPSFHLNSDTKEAVLNSYYIARFFQKCQKVKVMLVVDQTYFTECRSKKMQEIIIQLSKTVPDLSVLQQGLLLCINKSTEIRTEEEYRQRLKDMAEKVFTGQSKDFLKGIAEKQPVIVLPNIDKPQVCNFFQKYYKTIFWSQLDRLPFVAITNYRIVFPVQIQNFFEKTVNSYYIGQKMQKIRKKITEAAYKLMNCQNVQEKNGKFKKIVERFNNPQKNQQQDILTFIQQVLNLSVADLDIKDQLEISDMGKHYFTQSNPFLLNLSNIYTRVILWVIKEQDKQTFQKQLKAKDQEIKNQKQRIELYASIDNKNNKSKGKGHSKQPNPNSTEYFDRVLSDIFHMTHVNKTKLKQLSEGSFQALKSLMENLEKEQKKLQQVQIDSKIHGDVVKELAESIEAINQIKKRIELEENKKVNKVEKPEKKELQLLKRKTPINLRHRQLKDIDPAPVSLETYLTRKHVYSLDVRWLSTIAEQCIPERPKKMSRVQNRNGQVQSVLRQKNPQSCN